MNMREIIAAEIAAGNTIEHINPDGSKVLRFRCICRQCTQQFVSMMPQAMAPAMRCNKCDSKRVVKVA